MNKSSEFSIVGTQTGRVTSSRPNATPDIDRIDGKPLFKFPWLEKALDFIRQNPGCSKMAVVLGAGFPSPVSPDALPNGTKAARYTALTRLIRAGLVEDTGRGNRCVLTAKV